MNNDNILAWTQGKTDAVPPPHQHIFAAKIPRTSWLRTVAICTAALALAGWGLVIYGIVRTSHPAETRAVHTAIPAAEPIHPVPIVETVSPPPPPANPAILNRAPPANPVTLNIEKSFQRFANSIGWSDPPIHHSTRYHPLPPHRHWHRSVSAASQGYTGGCPLSICPEKQEMSK